MDLPTQIIILGASGDLAFRKLIPALAQLAHRGRPSGGFTVTGFSRRKKDSGQFRAELRAAMSDEDRVAFGSLCDRVFFLPGDVESVTDLQALSAHLQNLAGGAEGNRLFYFSLKPELFIPTVRNLQAAGLLTRCESGSPEIRVVVEKPFGHDLATAREINQALHGVLAESQIYRIDHYLGKETVQNLFAFRFHNTIFEPLWNRNHIDLVQITVAEELGVERGRAGYYDSAGAMRDMLQNHMLQILALIAMEAPASLQPEELRSQKMAVLNCLALDKQPVRGRYIENNGLPGYLQEDGVPANSRAETYVALRARLENWRWSGVPFLLRHGKRMKKRFTEVKVQFKVPPIQLFSFEEGSVDRHRQSGEICPLRPNVLTISIQPREALSLSFGVKTPGSGMAMSNAELKFDYRDRFPEAMTPAYERLLLDALLGDPSLFLRSDEVEASWRFADAVESAWRDQPIYNYLAGGWGPDEAEGLFEGCEGGWSRG